MHWPKKLGDDTKAAVFLFTLTHQAEHDLRMPAELTFRSWNPTDTQTNHLPPIHPFAIVSQLFKLY